MSATLTAERQARTAPNIHAEIAACRTKRELMVLRRNRPEIRLHADLLQEWLLRFRQVTTFWFAPEAMLGRRDAMRQAADLLEYATRNGDMYAEGAALASALRRYAEEGVEHVR